MDKAKGLFFKNKIVHKMFQNGGGGGGFGAVRTGQGMQSVAMPGLLQYMPVQMPDSSSGCRRDKCCFLLSFFRSCEVILSSTQIGG